MRPAAPSTQTIQISQKIEISAYEVLWSANSNLHPCFHRSRAASSSAIFTIKRGESPLCCVWYRSSGLGGWTNIEAKHSYFVFGFDLHVTGISNIHQSTGLVWICRLWLLSLYWLLRYDRLMEVCLLSEINLIIVRNCSTWMSVAVLWTWF